MQACDHCAARFEQLPVRIEIVRESGPIGLPGGPAGTSSNFSKGYAFCSSDHAYAWARERRYMLCNAAPTPFEEGMQPFLPSRPPIDLTTPPPGSPASGSDPAPWGPQGGSR